ncbi:FAD-binding protein [Streptacidiphilus carbonis]|uniref:FAD-binding protein n=1 Tax=Streptacidiphilus carbonis TaxID=105422 RepID=UPI0005AAE9E9|nr:FAD-binding protein [Streptacidiphilus carbonis]
MSGTTTEAGRRNWAGNVTFGAARIARPGTVDELRRTVAEGAAVRVLGTGHSFNRIADTDGTLVSLAELPPRFEVDRARSTVTVAAGMRHAQVAALLQAEGLALANLASLPHISVAGAVATGTHGSGVGNPGLASSVAGLELVGPDGDMVALDRDSAGFAGSVVHLGALGVVSAVTLDVEPAYQVAQYVLTGLPLASLATGDADEMAALLGAAYSVSVFTDWFGAEAQIWLKHRTDAGGTPRLDWFGAAPADRPLHPVPGVPATHCTEQLGVPGPWHERLPHFRPDFTPSAGEELQSEFLLPRAAAQAAFAALRELGHRIAPVLQISEIRTVAADELWLSPAYGRDSVALHFTWHQDAEAVAPVLAAVEAALTPLGARPHWGKLFTATPGQAADLYEHAYGFRELMDRQDPGGKFRNAFTRSLYAGGAA